ncbi:hypothetical protein DSO57_1019333 [Entomophthora muscae]|uniref:Uncharacterized protein n=1 Tax=Entomophthora muscae TaxID=34485 RepID=A0ACC2TRQ6_9FUNG|nr:hypothetical protein DSO57_1019333 [Entomophthora muscae]
MKEIPTTPPPPNAPPAQDFSKLGLVHITVLGLTNQIVPHNESWCPLASKVNYLIRIAPIVYMAFQARHASPVGVQPGSGMDRDSTRQRTCQMEDREEAHQKELHKKTTSFSWLS